MDLLQFLLPDLKASQRNVNISNIESQVATVLVATKYDMSDADIVSNVSLYNTRWAPPVPVDAQKIVDQRQLLKSIMTSSMPALTALESYCNENHLSITFDKVMIAPHSQFYAGSPSCAFSDFQHILEASIHNGQNIFTMLKFAGMPFSKDERISALNLYIELAKKAYIQQINAKLKFDSKVKFDWDTLRDNFGFNDLDCQVLRYVIWGMKRRLMFDSYTRRICLYIYSSQQALGKTELARAIYSPLAGLSQVMLPESFSDKNNFSARECYGPIIDDIDKAEKNQIGIIKNMLTAESTSARVFHTQRSTTIRVNAWPILTSNRRVEQVFSDTTGNTRYHEIEILQPVFNSIKDIEWQALWQSIDESQAELWSQADWDAFMNKAEEQRTRSYLDDFLDATLIQNHNETESTAAILEFDQEYTPYKLFQVFQLYSEDQVRKFGLTANKLANALRNAKFKDYDLKFTTYASGAVMYVKFGRTGSTAQTASDPDGTVVEFRKPDVVRLAALREQLKKDQR